MSKLCELDNCSGHPELPEGWTSWQEALHSSFTIVDVPGDNLSRWMDTEPIKRTETLGHHVMVDYPQGLTSVHRWTCLKCGCAVMRYHTNIYGSAVERECTDRVR